MIFFLGLQWFERAASLPSVPSTLQAWVTTVLFAFPALQLWDGVCRCAPTNESFQGFVLFICIDPLGGQSLPVLGTAQTQDNGMHCAPQGRFLALILLGQYCAQVLP